MQISLTEDSDLVWVCESKVFIPNSIICTFWGHPPNNRVSWQWVSCTRKFVYEQNNNSILNHLQNFRLLHLFAFFKLKEQEQCSFWPGHWTLHQKVKYRSLAVGPPTATTSRSLFICAHLLTTDTVLCTQHLGQLLTPVITHLCVFIQ